MSMPETGLRIRVFGDPVLRKKAPAVERINAQHRDLLSKMAQAMYAGSGVGLAAPQVGINHAMLVADIGEGLYKLINPKILKRQGRQVNQEGCLSVPEVCIKIRRANKILVQAQDEEGQKIKIEAEGLLACVFQHEIDHLKGKLIVDYASFWKKLKIKRKLAELKKKAQDERVSQSEAKSCPLQL